MRNKIFAVLIAVLLIAGTAQAVEWTQAFTAELSAQEKGRTITSDSSVIMNVWYTGTDTAPAVGVTGNTTMFLYSDVTAGTATSVLSGTYATVGAMVDYINSVSGWHASVGNDAYRAMSSSFMLGKNWASPGDREDNAYTILLDSSTATFMSCGVLPSVGRLGRIYSYETSLASSSGNMTISMYDGDTVVYRKYTPAAIYIGTGTGTSISTVTFSGSRGLSGTKNTPLCVVIDTDGSFNADTVAKAQNRVSIIYDKLAE